MNRLFALPLLAGTAALPLAWLAVPASAGGGCGEPMTEGRTTTVRIVHACFTPGIAKVPVGATVRWENRSGLLHNLSGAEGWFVDQLPDGSGAALKFTAAGIYPYACTLHPGMVGAVVVGNGTGALPPGSRVELGTSQLAAQPAAGTAAEAEANARGTVDTVPAAAERAPVAESDAGSPVLPWVVAGLLAVVAATLAIGRRTARIPREHPAG